jgi:DNA-3-methyladenine glycosylase II
MPRPRAVDSVKLALRHFKQVDPLFYAATQAHHASLQSQLGSKRTNAALFERLIQTVVSQQLGTAAARSIFTRLKDACGGHITPKVLLKLREPRLRKVGLSGAKVKTIKAVATAVVNGELNLLSLRKIPEAEAGDILMKIWGLGPWSVEMFLMFALGRADVFSAGDLGLIRAMEAIYELPKNAPRTSLLAISANWAPYRTYASLLLWKTRDSKEY